MLGVGFMNLVPAFTAQATVLAVNRERVHVALPVLAAQLASFSKFFVSFHGKIQQEHPRYSASLRA